MMINTVVIPVAGLGTRMLPATKAIPKEMLSIVDTPVIQLVVNELVDAGFTHIIFVTHASKGAIENHFDTSFELETTLERRSKRSQLQSVRTIIPPHVQITSVRQPSPLGLGHAIMCAKHIIGDRDFAVVLPDVLLEKETFEPASQNLIEMMTIFGSSGRSQIMVEMVPLEKVFQYGIVDISKQSLSPGEIAPISRVVEKPTPEDAPSRYAVVGRYVLSKEIWSFLEKTKPGAGLEIQLTDAIESMIEAGIGVDAYGMHGNSLDCGDKLGYATAFFKYALKDPSLAAPFLSMVRETIKPYG